LLQLHNDSGQVVHTHHQAVLISKINQSVNFYSGATTAGTTGWMMSGYDCLNKKRFNSRRKVDSEFFRNNVSSVWYWQKLRHEQAQHAMYWGPHTHGLAA